VIYKWCPANIWMELTPEGQAGTQGVCPIGKGNLIRRRNSSRR
jgi:hypothetical protein